jgi:hypothetical protein
MLWEICPSLAVQLHSLVKANKVSMCACGHPTAIHHNAGERSCSLPGSICPCLKLNTFDATHPLYDVNLARKILESLGG